MRRLAEMLRRMFVLRGAAAADVPATQAQAQVYPNVSRLQTIFVALGARRTLAMKLLRLEIKRRFAGLYVEGHRAMLMRDYPLAINLAEADGLAPPLLPRCPPRSRPLQLAR